MNWPKNNTINGHYKNTKKPKIFIHTYPTVAIPSQLKDCKPSYHVTCDHLILLFSTQRSKVIIRRSEKGQKWLALTLSGLLSARASRHSSSGANTNIDGMLLWPGHFLEGSVPSAINGLIACFLMKIGNRSTFPVTHRWEVKENKI